MNVLHLKSSELKEITQNLTRHKVIFHPSISPDGIPDFTGRKNRKHIIILDRNLLTPFVSLLRNGHLNDEHMLKLISSLIFWSLINNVSVNGGFALSEYANHKGGDTEANEENELFLKAFNHYHPTVWKDLALGRSQTIEPLSAGVVNTNSFTGEFDHYRMHFAEMLKIASLFYDTKLKVEKKIAAFHQWIYEKLIVGRYSLSYIAHLLGNRINTFAKSDSLDSIILKCKNQAWDLTYLSLWSTLYSKEDSEDTNYLFGTLDGGMKTVFIAAHHPNEDYHIKIFGNDAGGRMSALMLDTLKPRPIPKLSSEKIKQLITEELQSLKALIC